MQNIILLLLLVCSFSVNAQMHEEWATTVGDYSEGVMYSGNMVVDDEGNSYLYYMHYGVNPNWILKKFDSNGILLMQRDSLPASQHPSMARNGGLYFHKGNLYYLNYGGVVKYNTQLEEIWRYDDTFRLYDGFGRLAFDINDDIIVTYPEINPEINTTSYFNIKKISASGALVWQDSYEYDVLYSSYNTLLDSLNRFYISYAVEDNYITKQLLHQYGPNGLNWTYERNGTQNDYVAFVPYIQPNGDIWAVFTPAGTLTSQMAIVNSNSGQEIVFNSAAPPMPILTVDGYGYYLQGGASNFFTLVKKQGGTTIASKYFNTIFYNTIHCSNGYLYVVGMPFDALQEIHVFKLDTNLNLVQTFIHKYNNTVYNDHVFTESQIDSNGYLYFNASSPGYSAEVYRVCENCKGNITGDVVYDMSQNCVLDSGEIRLANRLIELNPGPAYAFTDITGVFSFRRPNGEYTVKAVPPPYWQSVCSDTLAVSLDSVNYAALDNRFFWYADPSLKNKEISITTGEASIGFEQYINMSYTNNGATRDSGTVILFLDTAFNLVEANPVPYSILGNKLVWNYNNLQPLEARSILVIATPPHSLGHYYKHVCAVYPLIDDVYPYDNVDSTRDEVVGSYDPNDKNCEVLNDNGQGFLTDSSILQYTIRFQNTGTDTAINIVIMDTLDAKLNLATFRMLQSSHTYQVSVIGDRILKWTFANIMLPDSHANQVLSNGFIKYSIEPLSGLTVGDAITNSASIYFDWNLPIKTNTTVNYYESYLGISNPGNRTTKLKVYPNPLSYFGKVEISNLLNEPTELIVYSIEGKLLWRRVFDNGTNLTIDRGELSSGMYVLEVRQNDTQVGFSRFIVE